MKILFGTDNFYPNTNGAANFTYRLIEGLVKKGHEIFVIAPSKKFKNTLEKYRGATIYGIRSVAIPKIIYPSGFRIPLITPFARIKKLVEKINPEVIHIQDHFMIGNAVARAGRQLAIPLLGTNNFMPENYIHYLHSPRFANKMLSKLAWKHLVSVYKYLNVLTTPTKTAVSFLKKLDFKNPIISISSGVELDVFNPKNNGNYLRKRYHISISKPVVLFVGRLDREKNINTAIKAFSLVLQSIDAQLVIAGQGKEKSNLMNFSKRLGIDKNVTFTGFISNWDLPSLYCMANVFVIASIAELQSIATMEAMASGLPVIAAKAVALPELVYHNQNGYLFRSGDTKSLAQYIVKILQNSSLQKKMSQKSLKIISRHNLQNTINSYEKIYTRLAAAKALPGSGQKYSAFHFIQGGR